VSEYIEIESPREIRRINNALFAKLKSGLHHIETRTIGYPQGNFQAKVRFLSDTGSDVLYWSAWRSEDRGAVGSFFGHGASGGHGSLNIDLQFNLPVVDFSRRLGGAFLRHVPTDSIVLAHRGIVTLGHGRVQKATLFSEMAATLREADTGNGSAQFLLIGDLDSPTLVGDIDSFSAEVRRAVRAIKANAVEAGGDRPKAASKTSRLSGKLRAYFDEFSGQRRVNWPRTSVADCYHGTVVRTLRDAFGSAETLKSQEIDLTVVTHDRVLLFEVKTSANRQSVYTAIGQLTAHAPIVARYAPRIPLVKVMVLPELPDPRIYNLLTHRLDIRLVTFTRSKQGRIDIHGLKRLK